MKDDIIKKINQLIHLDIDAVEAYQQALKNIDIPAIYNSLSKFRDDHLKHIEDLSNVVRHLGSEPPAQKPDLKGFIIEGFTAIRSATGTEGALKAMRMNEMLTNKVYYDALELELPADIKAIITKNYSDEQSHLKYIQQILEAKPWSPTGVPYS